MTEILYHTKPVFLPDLKNLFMKMNKIERKEQLKFYQSIFLCKCAEINKLYWLCAEKRAFKLRNISS